MTHTSIRKYNSLLKQKKYQKKRPKLINLCVEQILDKTDSHDTTYDIFSYDYKTITTNITINTELGKTLKKARNPNSLLKDFLSNENACAIYTDGSKPLHAKSAGSACVSHTLNLNITCSVNKVVSVYTAECIALSNAMDITLKNPSNNYVILSDSLSALQNLQATPLKTTVNPHILEIKKKYNEFLLKNPSNAIKFIWIPSHTGIYERESGQFSQERFYERT